MTFQKPGRDAPLRGGHKGNKQSLPSKPCAACGRPMTWRRAWAKIWEQVRYCSDACRRGKGPARPETSGG